MGKKGQSKAAELNRALRRKEKIEKGYRIASHHLVLSRLAMETRLVFEASTPPTDGWSYITDDGDLMVNSYQDASPNEWGWIFTHLLLHLGLGHTRTLLAEDGRAAEDAEPDPALAAAGCVAAHRFAEIVKIGHSLFDLPSLPGSDELELAQRWRQDGIPPEFRSLGVAGSLPCFCVGGNSRSHDWPGWKPTDYRKIFADSLAEATRTAMSQAAERHGVGLPARTGPWHDAVGWFVSTYPLLGALAAGLEIVADAEITKAWGITVAAVSAEAGEIYVNPHAALDEHEWRFVLAHEMLHAALRHDARQGGRDPYLFNVAADYAINGWLVEMGVGAMPEGCLYDPRLRGMSAESIYDTLTTDLRRARKLRTLGAREAGDVLGPWLSDPAAAARRGSRRKERPAPPWDHAAWGRTTPVRATDLDAFYRRALSTGLAYHEAEQRGLLPAGLVEEIRALEHPPLDWDARLARWFDEHVRAPEPVRSYARVSRRQSATPDIPRPGRIRPERLERRATFGVVLDTSGSMNRTLLGKALGAIASYATARDVPAARVVFCDAAAHDAGYLEVTDIAGRVRVHGRGGTRLQPGIRLLERAEDFPADGPILIITDARCDTVRVRREHAFLVPRGARLPFRPRGPVFEMH